MDPENWILFNASGEEVALKVDKHAIMHRMQIHSRDLRTINIHLSYSSIIILREKIIVLNLEHIKAIITSKEVLLREPLNEKVIPVVEELRRRLKPNKANSEHQPTSKCEEILTLADHPNCEGKENIVTEHNVEMAEEDEFPFEFKALEVALEAICNYLECRTTEMEASVYRALDMLTAKIHGCNLDRVRKLKSGITRLIARVQKVRDELEQLLDDDDDMANFYLSRKLAGPGSCATSWFLASPTICARISKSNCASAAAVGMDENNVQELEMLLEAYFKQLDGTLNNLIKLREYIDDTEDYVNIQLANRRNQLMQLELVLSAGTVCVSILAVVTGVFGMNIKYTWTKNHAYMFKWVIIFSSGFCALLFILITSYARYKRLIGS